MRQRVISDSFWRDPEIADVSHEDKGTLLYFLTSPSSNIIGGYRIVWRIAAAEMGWTADQLMVVIKRLKTLDLIDYNEDGWIWVKVWWKHNSIAGAFSPKLTVKAQNEFDCLPANWKAHFLDWLEKSGLDRVSIPYLKMRDRVPPNSNVVVSVTGDQDQLDPSSMQKGEAIIAAVRNKMANGEQHG